jgi:hypothetical protein
LRCLAGARGHTLAGIVSSSAPWTGVTIAMGTPVIRQPTAAAPRPVVDGGLVTAGALARLASIAAIAAISWPDGPRAVGIQALNLPILAAGGALLAAGALVAHRGRLDRPGLRLALLVVSALSAWPVPYVLVVNLALVDFAVTEPGEICHDVPCQEGAALTILIVVAALGSIADALLSTAGAVRICRQLPAGALRRAGWSVLTCGALLTAASIVLYAYRW